jgi:tetratricopeptide (TPR) repeat protein
MSRCLPTFAGFLLIWLCFPGVSFACLWLDGSTIHGNPETYSPLRSPLQRLLLWKGRERSPTTKLEELERISKRTVSDERERTAVRDILSGGPAKAIPLLQEVERDAPGNYSTAANLGTAYELTGDNRNALKWITEAIRRNPKSHEGTEWLHALILETKLRMETDPDYLKTHRIIPLPNDFTDKTKVNIAGTERSIGEIIWALVYQLEERMVFVKPPDPIVADLLFTCALCEAHVAVVEGALKLLAESQSYGFQDPGLIGATESHYLALIKVAQTRRWVSRGLIAIGVLGGSAGILYYCYRRKWFFLTPGQRRRYLESKKAAL